MQRILIFYPTIAPYRVDFFNALNNRYEVRICLRYNNLLEQHFENYQSIIDGCNFVPIVLPYYVKMGSRYFSRGILSQIKQFNPDIVVGIEYSFETCAALAYRIVSRKKYKVMTICDDSFDMVSNNHDFSKLHKIMRKLVAPRLDQIILASPEACQWYINNFGKGTYFPIIRNERTELLKYVKVLPISNQYVSDYRLKGKHVFLFVGRLVALKKVDNIIEAFNKLDCENSVLVIVGDGESREYLKEKAKKSSKIIFTGRLEGDELIAWYNLASCFVLASKLEPFGAVTNEALLGGCTAIVSKESGSSCLIKEGINGYVFDSDDVDALSAYMKKSLNNPVLDFVVPRNNMMIECFSDMFEKLIISFN